MSQIDVKTLKAYTTMPSIKSKDAEWIAWADEVIGKYGDGDGTLIFINTWKKRGSREANTYALRQHLEKRYGIQIDESAWDKVVDLGQGIAGGFSKFMKAGKITAIVLGGLLVVAVGFAAYNTVKGGVSPIKFKR